MLYKQHYNTIFIISKDDFNVRHYFLFPFAYYKTNRQTGKRGVRIMRIECEGETVDIWMSEAEAIITPPSIVIEMIRRTLEGLQEQKIYVWISGSQQITAAVKALLDYNT